MCYSAIIQQDLKSLRLKFQTRIQTDMLDDLFKRRANGEKISVAPALEHQFWNPHSTDETSIKKHIELYRQTRLREEEEDLFAQKKRLADADRKLAAKATKTAQKDKEIAERKISRGKVRISELQHDPDGADARIWAKYYAPVILFENGQRVIKPMRYLCRPMGFPESFDRDYPGCYNARRDSLKKFWKNLYMRNHAILVISSFFENVKKHDYEKRKLRKGETEENLVLQFTPRGFDEIIVPCIWDRWSAPGQPDLYSFALITDEPPVEIAQAGHDRCPIFLKKENIDRWLRPDVTTENEIEAVLNDRETPLYENRQVA